MDDNKLIFFDVDGTLEDQYRHIPESAVITIKKLKKSGHKLYIASGRPMWQIHDNICELGFEGYIASAGAYVEVGKRVLVDQCMEQQMFLSLADYLVKNKALFIAETTKVSYMLQSQYQQNLEFTSRIPFFRDVEEPELIGRASDITDVKKVLAFSDELTIAQLIDDWKGIFDVVEMSYTRGARMGFEMGMSGINKAEAMEKLVDYVKGDMENVIAVGDSDNDIEMLQKANFGIVMGNASEKVKATANYVSKEASENGLYLAFRKLRMI